VVQRVGRAAVDVAGERVAAIGPGLLILVAVGRGDGPEDVAYLADKVANLRVFEDEEGRMNRSLKDIGGEALAVPQFTLYGDARRGRRPSFSASAGPEEGERLFDLFVEALAAQGPAVAMGRFRAHMEVSLVNDGPVTILLDSGKTF